MCVRRRCLFCSHRACFLTLVAGVGDTVAGACRFLQKLLREVLCCFRRLTEQALTPRRPVPETRLFARPGVGGGLGRALLHSLVEFLTEILRLVAGGAYNVVFAVRVRRPPRLLPPPPARVPVLLLLPVVLPRRFQG